MTRKSKEAQFFDEKKSWSTMKDQILGSYIVPYLNKVLQLRRKVVLVDAFAGPGRFKDGTYGSPVILTNAAEHWARDRYIAVFGNVRKDHHEALTVALGTLIAKGRVTTVRKPASELLADLYPTLGNATVFLYLDPFGLKGCEFASLRPYLQRSSTFSTEILINIPPQTIHRLASTRASLNAHHPDLLDAFNRRLNRVLGGNYWESILSDVTLGAEEKTRLVVAGYRKRLEKYFSFTGSCPVREKHGAAVKYYMTFCSRHPDSLLLFNDAMCSAYHERIHAERTKGTLFEGSSWRSERSIVPLQRVIMSSLQRTGRESREDLWLHIVRNHFMEFHSTEYKDAVRRLVAAGRIGFEDVRGTGRLNDWAVLYMQKVVGVRSPSELPTVSSDTTPMGTEEPRELGVKVFKPDGEVVTKRLRQDVMKSVSERP